MLRAIRLSSLACGLTAIRVVGSPAAIRLESEQLALTCLPHHGCVVTSIQYRGSELLWTRPRFEPIELARTIGPAGSASIDTFMDGFIGGWFPMIPSVGLPGNAPDAFALLHGEVARLPWTVTESTPRSLTLQVATIRTPFEVERAYTMTGRRIRCVTTLRNVGRESAPFLWGEHPCFAREAFAGGRIELGEAHFTVPAPPLDPANARVETGTSGLWPNFTDRDGEPFDGSVVPREPDGRHEHLCVTPLDGSATLVHPGLGVRVVLRFDERAYPYALIWQNYRAPGTSCWGAVDTFTVEPSNNPGRTADDAIAAGSVATLAAGAEAEAFFEISIAGDEATAATEGG